MDGVQGGVLPGQVRGSGGRRPRGSVAGPGLGVGWTASKGECCRARLGGRVDAVQGGVLPGQVKGASHGQTQGVVVG